MVEDRQPAWMKKNIVLDLEDKSDIVTLLV